MVNRRGEEEAKDRTNVLWSEAYDLFDNDSQKVLKFVYASNPRLNNRSPMGCAELSEDLLQMALEEIDRLKKYKNF